MWIVPRQVLEIYLLSTTFRPALAPTFNVYWGFFQQVKAPGRKNNHPTPSSAEVKKAWSPTPIPPHAFIMLTGTMTLLTIQGKTAFWGVSCFLVTFRRFLRLSDRIWRHLLQSTARWQYFDKCNTSYKNSFIDCKIL